MLGILFRNLPIKPKVYNGLSLSRALCTEAPLEKLKKTSGLQTFGFVEHFFFGIVPVKF